MISINFDKTYCGSPNCQNKCGRQLPIDSGLRHRLNTFSPSWDTDIRIWYSDFCDKNGEVIDCGMR